MLLTCFSRGKYGIRIWDVATETPNHRHNWLIEWVRVMGVESENKMKFLIQLSHKNVSIQLVKIIFHWIFSSVCYSSSRSLWISSIFELIAHLMRSEAAVNFIKTLLNLNTFWKFPTFELIILEIAQYKYLLMIAYSLFEIMNAVCNVLYWFIPINEFGIIRLVLKKNPMASIEFDSNVV